jgi:hypothetical protein
VFLVRYELCFYTPEDDVLHSHRSENLKSYMNFPLKLSSFISYLFIIRTFDTASTGFRTSNEIVFNCLFTLHCIFSFVLFDSQMRFLTLQQVNFLLVSQ